MRKAREVCPPPEEAPLLAFLSLRSPSVTPFRTVPGGQDKRRVAAVIRLVQGCALWGEGGRVRGKESKRRGGRL